MKVYVLKKGYLDTEINREVSYEKEERQYRVKTGKSHKITIGEDVSAQIAVIFN